LRLRTGMSFTTILAKRASTKHLRQRLDVVFEAIHRLRHDD
jgi:hypothetical protein